LSVSLLIIFPFSISDYSLQTDHCFEFDTKILENILSNFFNKYYIITLNYINQIVILTNFEDDIYIKVLYKELSILKTENNCIVKGIGVSRIVDKLDLISTLYKDALRFLYFHRYSFSDPIYNENNINYIFSQLDCNLIPAILESKTKDELDELLNIYLRKLLSINKKKSFHLNSVYSIVIVDIILYFQDLGIPIDNVFSMSNSDEKIITINNDIQLKNQVSKLILQASKYLSKENKYYSYSENVVKMLDFINSNYMNNISLDDMAETANLHPNYASSLFKKEIGTNFIQYLNSYRVLKAKAFLKRNTELSLDRIAKMVGYESSGRFIKVFKKYCSVTPGEYRNKLNL
jgi:two-component system, response regulator YesN